LEVSQAVYAVAPARIIVATAAAAPIPLPRSIGLLHHPSQVVERGPDGWQDPLTGEVVRVGLFLLIVVPTGRGKLGLPSVLRQLI
jgi:hypothetical protein